MVAKTRQMRRERTSKHIPSPKAWDQEHNCWIVNPEVKEKKKKEAEKKKKEAEKKEKEAEKKKSGAGNRHSKTGRK